MPSFFQTLQQASFNGIKFPVREVNIVGGIRDHEHEYPHAPGSAPEKLGRKAYKFQMQGLFFQNLPKYPNLYPSGLDNLRDAFEQQLSGDLVIPTIGTITAYARDWRQVASFRALSGEVAEFLFVEDQSQLFLSTNLVSTGATSLANQAAAFNAQAALEAFQLPLTIGALDAVQNDINAVLAIQDTANAVSNLMSAKLGALVNDLHALDACAEMQQPSHSVFLDIMHTFWDTAQQLNQSLIAGQGMPKTYVVRALCSVSQASIAIYGDSSHATDLMNLNALTDPFQIPAGTSLIYYPATSAT